MENRLRMMLLVSLAVLLGGCSMFDGSYSHVTPHVSQNVQTGVQASTVGNYVELRDALRDLVALGRESGIVYVVDMDSEAVDQAMITVKHYLCSVDPVGAFALEDMTYEIGNNSGKTAVAVTMQYRHSSIDIQKITHVKSMEEVEAVLLRSLENYESRKAILIDSYLPMDFAQMVRDISQTNPQTVMEIPNVSEGVYGEGDARVVELNFAFENSRDALRQMQIQIRPVFDAAALYVSGDGSDYQKYSQLFAFLMERFDYTVETSITPSYSLLHHGVGDSRAFATVFAAMCRKAGLECQTVIGTRDGVPWTWNIICDDGNYYHLDLLRCSETDGFRESTDGQMNGYVWDYSSYPECKASMPTEPEVASETDENILENFENNT